MPKPTKRAPVKSSSQKKAKTASKAKPAKKATPAKKAKPAKAAKTVTTADEAAYLEMLVKTGQAGPAGRKLPPGATHVVVTDEKGKPKVVRRRASIS